VSGKEGKLTKKLSANGMNIAVTDSGSSQPDFDLSFSGGINVYFFYNQGFTELLAYCCFQG
jgi:hypothetical protein